MYFITLLLIFATALIISTNLPRYCKIITLSILWFWLSIFIGLRLSGWDAAFYADLNQDAVKLSFDLLLSKYQLTDLYSIETGYLLCLHLLSHIFDPLTILSLMTVGSYYVLLRKSLLGSISLAIGIAFSPWYGLWDVFNAPRQASSVIFASLALFLISREILTPYSTRRNLRIILLTSLLFVAISFHTTTAAFVLCFLLYVICRPGRLFILLMCLLCYIKPILPSTIDFIVSLPLIERHRALLFITSITNSVTPFNFKVLEVLGLAVLLTLVLREPTFSNNYRRTNVQSIFTYFPLFGAALTFLLFSEISIAWERLTLPYTMLMPITIGNTLFLFGRTLKGINYATGAPLILLLSSIPFVTYRYNSLVNNSIQRSDESHADVLFPYKSREIQLRY